MPKIDKADEGRTVLYPDISTEICRGDTALDADRMKKLLGWQEEGEKDKFGTNYFTVVGKTKVRANNNITNRPVYDPTVKTLLQEVLNRRWKLNGEPFIIGKTGLVLNGQHTALALILAQLEREGKDKDHWDTIWGPGNPVTIEKVIIYGVEEDDATVNTMDTAKPRSLMDVIYRSEFFAKLKENDRKNASRITDFSVRALWMRTGAKQDAYAPLRTHAESLDFIHRHPSVLKAVKHILAEDKGGKDAPSGNISNYIQPGTAAGLMYLMAASESDGPNYRQADPPVEKKADLSMWDKAHEFWVLLASGSAKFQPLKDAIGRLGSAQDSMGGNLSERMGIIIKAWNEFAHGGALTPGNLKLKYGKTDDGMYYLDEVPDVGGIDIGASKVSELDGTDTGDVEDPTEAEVAAGAAEIKAANLKKKAGEPAPKETPKAPPAAPKKAPPAPPKKAPTGKAKKGEAEPLRGGTGK
jgi:hypothetical protein